MKFTRGAHHSLMLFFAAVFLFAGCAMGGPLAAKSYYVSPMGSDSAAGTLAAPLATMQAAADRMTPGDTCILRGGVYRQTLRLTSGGTAAKPITFKAYPGEVPVLDGTDVVRGTWEKYKGKIYRTQLKAGLSIGQVFVDKAMMTWARWPNATFKDRWANTKWAPCSGTLGTLLGGKKLAKTGIDWTGAIVMLNTKPNWDKWTAIVQNHAKGKDRFNYSKALQWKTKDERQDGSYSLHGILKALDTAEEWYYDAKTGMLYLYCPKGDTPASHVVEVKTRTYGVYAETCDFVELKGIHFRATTFNFRECHHCLVDGCHIRFPNVAPLLSDLNMPSRPMVATQMIGHHNTVRNSSLAYSPTFGLRMLGSYNRVENNLIYDVNWVGSLCYSNVWMGSLEDNYTWEGCLKYEGLLKETVPQATAEELTKVQWGGKMGRIVKVHDPDRANPAGHCVVRHNTLFGSGNIVLGFFEQPNFDIGYNHVYDGGMFVHDVSMIYTTLPQIRGSVVHHNWVTTKYKLCIRADDQSRGVAVHHNVMWGSSKGSLVVKGEDNAVYHNTSLVTSPENRGLNVQTWAEPDKPHYRKLWPLLKEQNAKTPIWNNLSHRITYTHLNKQFAKDDPRLSHNVTVANPASLLVNPAGLDFRPKPGSPLIDAGRVIKGINDGFVGKAPDAGAYEFGAKPWVAGHKNFIRTSGETTDPKSGERVMMLCLGMPAVKTITVTVVPAAGVTLTSKPKLVFTAGNWAVGRTVRFKASKEIRGKAITFEIEQPR